MADKTIAVIGSRSFDKEIVFNFLDAVLPFGDNFSVISGGAKGVDSAVREYCKEMNISFEEILPDYHRFGKAAPHVRNQRIIDQADEIVAIWDGSSKGTESVINKAIKKKIKLTIIEEAQR